MTTNSNTESTTLAWMSNKGIRLLELRAREEFELHTGISFPWQLVATEEEGEFGHDYSKWWCWRLIEPSAHQAELESAARYAGWLHALTFLREGLDSEPVAPRYANMAYPAVLRLIAAGQSSRGLYSPYTAYTADDLFAAWPSPGRLNRVALQVRREARAILAEFGFAGAEPSWVNTGRALLQHHRPRRAAQALAALTMFYGGGGYPSYDRIRPTRRWTLEVLMRLSLGKRPYDEREFADGSRAWRQRHQLATKGGGYRWVPAWVILPAEGGRYVVEDDGSDFTEYLTSVGVFRKYRYDGRKTTVGAWPVCGLRGQVLEAELVEPDAVWQAVMEGDDNFHVTIYRHAEIGEEEVRFSISRSSNQVYHDPIYSIHTYPGVDVEELVAQIRAINSERAKLEQVAHDRWVAATGGW